jgi:hypothetical protein
VLQTLVLEIFLRKQRMEQALAAFDRLPLVSAMAIRWWRLGAGVAALAAATVFALALAVGAPAGPGAKLGIWAVPEPEIVYLPQREAQQLLAQQQALGLVYSPEGQTDMWIRIAEAIDKDAVNNPALPPVSDAIKDEAAKAQSGTHSQKPSR